MDYKILHPGMHSALLYSPSESRIKRAYVSKLFEWIETLPTTTDKWRRDFLVLESHDDWIRDISFSPDGQLFASASDDKTVRVWDADTGTTQHTFAKHRDWVYSVAIASTGMIASCADERTVKLWDVNTGCSHITFQKTPQTVEHLRFSPDESKLIASMPRIIRIYDLTKNEHRDLRPPVSGITVYTRLSPDDRFVASASRREPTIYIWDPTTFESTHKLEDHDEPINALIFSPNSQLMASCSEDSTVIIWDTETWRVVHRLACGGDVHSCSFFPSGSRLVSTSSNDEIRIWCMKTGRLEDVIRGYGFPAKVVAVSPDSRYIASAGDDGVIRFWFSYHHEAESFQGHNQAPPNTRRRSGESITAVTISPSGKYIASAGVYGEIRLWDGETGQRLHEDTHRTHKEGINSLMFSSDECTLASASEDCTLQLWDVANWELIRILKARNRPVLCATFSPDGKLIASGSDDPDVRVWSVEGEVLEVLRGHWRCCRTVAFSCDGRLLVSAGDDRCIFVWRVSDWKQFRDPIKTGVAIVCVAISPDSTQILASTRKGEL